MKAPLYSKEGKKKSEVVLNPDIFGANVNERLLQLVKNAYAANLRQGNAHTKERAEVRGGGRKPWKQKGTGNARAGSRRSPIWKGGGTTFGPRKKDYSVNLPKSMRLSALVSALSLKANEKKVSLLENTQLENAKTKEWAEIMHSLPPVQGQRALCVVKDKDEKLSRAVRNLQNWVTVKKASDFTAYDVLQRDRLIIDQEALEVIDQRLIRTEKDG